jgi:hypothetical protein
MKAEEQNILVEEICKLIEKIELEDKNTSMAQWKQYKCIRNKIRDKFFIKDSKKKLSSLVLKVDTEKDEWTFRGAIWKEIDNIIKKAIEDENVRIKEKDLEILLDRGKASLNISGWQSKLGFNYSEQNFVDALNRVLDVLGDREIDIDKDNY